MNEFQSHLAHYQQILSGTEAVLLNQESKSAPTYYGREESSYVWFQLLLDNQVYYILFYDLNHLQITTRSQLSFPFYLVATKVSPFFKFLYKRNVISNEKDKFRFFQNGKYTLALNHLKEEFIAFTRFCTDFSVVNQVAEMNKETLDGDEFLLKYQFKGIPSDKAQMEQLLDAVHKISNEIELKSL